MLIVLFYILTNTYKRLSLFTTTSCNLNCKYCIEKKWYKAWQISQPQDYSIYINKLLELNIKNKDTLESIELWGGEPLLGMTEFINYLPQFIETFPNLHEIQFSSNYVIEESYNIIKLLTKTISENTNKQFTIKLQLSIDGPIEINDNNRGVGSTTALLNNLSNYYSSIYDNVILDIKTNSTFYRQNLFSFLSYNDVENWFNFFLNNFPSNIKFGIFRPAKEVIWNNDDGIRYAQILEWANQWKINHPEEAKRFIWFSLKPDKLKLCAAGVKDELIAIAPNGKIGMCYQAILNGFYINKQSKYPLINLTRVYDYLMDQYIYYKDKISLDDFKRSLNLYISIMWCPYYNIIKDTIGKNTWFTKTLPLYYNGAMNILLQWSEENG